MKKSYLIISLSILICGTTYLSSESKDKITYQSMDATYRQPSDIKELEESSDYIIKAIYTGESEIDTDEEVIAPSTISKVKVDKVYKGNLDESEISVLEPYTLEDNEFNNLSGYMPMTKDCEYVLFLRKNELPQGDQYTIISINYGKYNLSSDSSVKLHTNEIKHLDEVKDADFVSDSQLEAKLYEDIKEDIIKKYK